MPFDFKDLIAPLAVARAVHYIPPERRRAMRVLVVDDDESLRLTLGLLLRARGFEVEQAASGEEALEKLAAGAFDALVSDVRMGRVSGTELACRAKRAWPGLRVVLMSGFCHAEDLTAAPVDGFTEKPPDLDFLVSLLGEATQAPHPPLP